MSDVLARIDNTLSDLCPCGADPRPGSPYCSADCEPTHIAAHTDTRSSGDYATPMRWRPDLVTAADDTDLTPLGSDTCGYQGRHNAQIFERATNPTIWHLRLDDGHRYVGCDVPDMGGRQDPISVDMQARIRDTWQRLEGELGNPNHTVPGEGLDEWRRMLRLMGARIDAVVLHEDPWADTHPVVPAPAGPDPLAVLNPATPHPALAWQPGSDPIEDLRNFDVTAALDSMDRAFQQATRNMAPLINALRDAHEPVLRQFTEAAAQTDSPPEDPMARALWLRRNRNTGPAAPPLDPRRRRR